MMAEANPLWGAPSMHGELLKLGIKISKRTVSNLMPRRDIKPPFQTWQITRFNVTFNPTVKWAAEQIVDAFPSSC
jgi:hypothetical protein